MINSSTLEPKLGIQGIHRFREFLILKHSIKSITSQNIDLNHFMQEPMRRINNRNFYVFKHLWKAFKIGSFKGRRVKDEIIIP